MGKEFKAVRCAEVFKLDSGWSITLSEREAIATINSLAAQLLARSPNVGRRESRTDKGEYFSVFVDFTK